MDIVGDSRERRLQPKLLQAVIVVHGKKYLLGVYTMETPLS